MAIALWYFQFAVTTNKANFAERKVWNPSWSPLQAPVRGKGEIQACGLKLLLKYCFFTVFLQHISQISFIEPFNFLLHWLNIPTGINKASAYLIFLIHHLVSDVCSSVSYRSILLLQQHWNLSLSGLDVGAVFIHSSIHSLVDSFILFSESQQYLFTHHVSAGKRNIKTT